MKKTPCAPVSPVCEYLVNPLGLQTKTPRLSWRLEDPRKGAVQKAYRIVAASTAAKLADGKFDLWDTGRVDSDQCLDVVYAGKKLKARSAVWWKVMVWDMKGDASDWSDPATFEIGLFDKGTLAAKWIGPEKDRTSQALPSPYLRREFTLASEPVKARLHVSACGAMELYLNGAPASADCLAPGWTDYRKHIELVTYDVTSLLRKGANAFGAVLGDGWFAGNLAWGGNRCTGGKNLALLAQLEVELADGSSFTLLTDESWKYTEKGPIRSSDYYHGELYDARLELGAWTEPGYKAAGWKKVKVIPPGPFAIGPRPNNGIQRQQTLTPVKLTEPTPGAYVFDLAQNMVGHVAVRFHAKAGAKFTMRYAEMLNADGTLYTTNYRAAKSTDYYVCRGSTKDDCEIYESHFTFHGFRYVELTGDFEEPPVCEDVCGVVLHTTMTRTGQFECSDALANQLYSNLNWGQVGNYLDVPTDCPQRDERLGWTGDAQVFVRTGAYNRDVAAFFTKWQRDLVDSQHANGAFTDVAPDMLSEGNAGHCAWGDAGVICPWTMYLMYGDTGILREHYGAMARWLDYWASVSTPAGLVRYRGVWHYGDWLSVDCPVDENGNPYCGNAPTPSDLISTAYYARCARIMADVARILGRAADAKKFAALFAKVRKAYQAEFVTPTGRVAGDTQTAYLLTLGFDLVTDKALVAHMLDRLAFLIESRRNTLTTGFVGTPLICPVLSRFGRSDLAYTLFHQTEYPSWNYTILQGATTMWERWNSYTKKHGFGDAGMNSFNHYAYGAIGEWMYATVAGLEVDPAKPGFKHAILQPTPGGKLTHASGSLLTRYGTLSCAWRIDGGSLVTEVVVPPNTTATLRLPGRPARELAAGAYTFKTPYKGN